MIASSLHDPVEREASCQRNANAQSGIDITCRAISSTITRLMAIRTRS